MTGRWEAFRSGSMNRDLEKLNLLIFIMSVRECEF